MNVTNKEYFHCSVCGKTSTVEKKIKDCEASHVQIDTDKTLTTNYKGSRNSYPSEIGVPMADGKTAYYSFNFMLEARK